MDSSFDLGSMLSLPDRALLVKLFYKNGESTTIALRKFRTEKGLKAQKSPISLNGILNLVRRFEETGSLEDRPRSGRPSLSADRVHAVKSAMEKVAAETSTGSSSAREAGRITGIPQSSIRRILHGILDLYPYKIQTLHQLVPADTGKRLKFATWALAQMDRDPQWLLNVMWTDEAHFSLHGDVNTQNSRIWATSNPREYQTKPMHSPRVTVWCGFTAAFILGPFFFEESCPASGWKTCTVTAERYLTLLRNQVVPALQERHALPSVTFMQDGAPAHFAREVKAFLLDTFTEDRVISRGCKFEWPPRSPDLTPADFWLWGYLKSRVYRCSPATLAELKDAIRLTVGGIDADMLYSAVTGVLTRLTCLIPCGGGHVEHILLP